MAWGGQLCTSPGYAYVDASIAEEFVSEAKKAVVDLYGSDPRNNPDYSRIISAKEVNRLSALIDPAKKSPEAERMRRHVTSIPRSFIPSPGTTRSWKTRFSAPFCRS